MSGSRGSAAFLAVDLGKSRCRLGIGHDRAARAFEVRLEGEGAVGLAERDGPDAALRAVTRVLDTITAGGPAGSDACIAGAGYVPGPWSHEAARLFVKTLDLRSCAVTSDAIASHVGALDGGAGAVLAAGTGSVAVGVSTDGHVHLVDGAGQWLGDDGSGAWIGLEGLRAALRSRDGRGPHTSLEPHAAMVFGDLALLPRTLNDSGNMAQVAATFAGVVYAEGEHDPVASSIIEQAARALAGTTVAAARRAETRQVALVGGLKELGPRLVDPWRALVTAEGLIVVDPVGSALDGAARLAVDRTLPHEVAVTRVHA